MRMYLIYKRRPMKNVVHLYMRYRRGWRPLNFQTLENFSFPFRLWGFHILITIINPSTVKNRMICELGCRWGIRRHDLDTFAPFGCFLAAMRLARLPNTRLVLSHSPHRLVVLRAAAASQYSTAFDRRVHLRFAFRNSRYL